jgi:hypothetical protein
MEWRVVRQSAEWMDPVDERILELIQERGNLTPDAIEKFGVTSANHASRRCKLLSKYGLLSRIVTGLYGITQDGEAFLQGDLDAAEIEPVED